MKQLSKILAASHHCSTIVLSDIEIIDADSPFNSLQIMPKLVYKCTFYTLSNWDAKLFEKVFKAFSQNNSLQNN